MNRSINQGQNEFSLTLLQLAAGCALLVFGLRVLAPAPVQAPQWPAPAVATALMSAEQRAAERGSADREAVNCEGNQVMVEDWRPQTAACVTAGDWAAELAPPLSI